MKIGDLSLVYGILALFSALLWITYLVFAQHKNRLFLLLFSCVLAANGGYFLLAICNSLIVAKIANAISYFGGAFSLLTMVLILCEVCRIPKCRWLQGLLITVSIAAFSLAADGDYLGLYYRSVSLENINGMTCLIKEYGPLHILYALYLLSYMMLMLGIIAYAAKTKRLVSPKYTMFLLATVLINLGVWLVEQMVDVNFEFLSVSYIVTAVLLLLIHGVMCDYGIIQPSGSLISVEMLTQLNTRRVNPGELPPEMEEMFRSFSDKVKTLSPAERRILNLYVEGREIAEIPELAYVSIHTVKKHNRSIYQKLGISSRDELMLYIELFRCCNRLEELIDNEEAKP